MDFHNKESFYLFWRKEYILRNDSFQDAWAVFKEDKEGNSPGYQEKIKILEGVHFLPWDTEKTDADWIIDFLWKLKKQGDQNPKTKDVSCLWDKPGMFLGGGLSMRTLPVHIQNNTESVTVGSFFERDIMTTTLEMQFLYWIQRPGKETDKTRTKAQESWERLIRHKVGKAHHWPRAVGLWLWDHAAENGTGGRDAIDAFLSIFEEDNEIPKTWKDDKLLARAFSKTRECIEIMDVLPMR